MTEQSGTPRRIVVGVDGSPSSVDALRWAVHEARVRGAVVEAVSAWQYQVAVGWTVPVVPEGDFSAIAREVLDNAIAEVADAEQPVEIHPHVVEGLAAAALLTAAQDADLLVVGSRGHGGFAGALLGSVSQHCVQHAPCPVVVVRHREDPRPVK
ncbi:universal stress protein [Kitasatospora sp. SUK 42]|uniref:universal stress protein n=1 Tax=Kitasatospora sp. SUK 42 TaxID=1588882 RepID=UPI0018C91606|nr:universal stress protein [Kitasatospora sp. SUK 42]MBV2155162.1 universal stress protein [Kitasatospora sp. SUK 42]